MTMLTVARAREALAPRLAGLAALAERHPVATLAFAVAAQHALTLWSRDLWWADEVRQASVLRRMLRTGEWFALWNNASPYPDKPPLYFWLQAALARLFGSSGPPVVLFGLAATVFGYALAAYALARGCGLSRRTSLLAALLPMGCPYFVLVAHYARMDFLFAAFIALAWLGFYRASLTQGFSWAMVGGFAAASAATMTKGPFGLVFPLSTLIVALAWRANLRRLFAADALAGAAVFAATIALWAASVAAAFGPGYVLEILHSQILDRGLRAPAGPLGPARYLVTAPLAFLPWTLLAFIPAGAAGSWREVWRRRAERSGGRTFLVIAAATSLAALSLTAEKHEYYLIPTFLPLAALAAERIGALPAAGAAAMSAGLRALLFILALACAAAACFAPPPWSAPSLYGAALALGAVGAASLAKPARSLKPTLALFLAGLTLWANVVALFVLPELNGVMSPRRTVDALRAGVRGEGGVAVYGLVRGVLGYDLDAVYYEAKSPAALELWLRAHPGSVFATPNSAWNADFAPRPSYTRIETLDVAGDKIVVGRLAEAAPE